MKAFAVVVLTALAACAPTAKPARMAEANCGDTKLGGFVGKVWAEPMRADLLKQSGARALRVIGPDTVVTMDYRLDRVNVDTDAQGRITRIRCG